MQVSQVKCQIDQLKKSQNNNCDVEFMRYDERKLNKNEKKIKVNSLRFKTQETKFK